MDPPPHVSVHGPHRRMSTTVAGPPQKNNAACPQPSHHRLVGFTLGREFGIAVKNILDP